MSHAGITCSLRHASEEYCIPKSTLQDHISGKVLQGGSSGKRYLDDVEEEEIVVFLKGCAQMEYPRTRKDVIGLVQTVLQAKGRERDTVSSTG